MDTLQGTHWDVIIAGTGLQPALLALALSHSGKKILHVDGNNYYGGAEAALSLSEAEAWVNKVQDGNQDGNNTSFFKNASITTLKEEDKGQQSLGPARQYSLSLTPTLLYTRSALLSCLVSSKAHEQLEFLAVGSWFVFQSSGTEAGDETIRPAGRLLRVPNSREDIFSDPSLSIRTKGALVKFLRFVATHDSEDKKDVCSPYKDRPFVEFLVEQFKIQPDHHGPLLALCMNTRASAEVNTTVALESIYRHLSSMGVFGAGFSAVLSKYGGLSEVIQVACRAAAVTGAVYVLNQGIEEVKPAQQSDTTAQDELPGRLQVMLRNGDKVTTTHLFGTPDQLCPRQPLSSSDAALSISKSISIVGSRLNSLFPPSTEGSPAPSAAIVVFASDTLHDSQGQSNPHPVYSLVHSGDSGECLPTQCVIYTSTTTSSNSSTLLKIAVQRLLSAIDEQPSPSILWSMECEHVAPSLKPELRQSVIPGVYEFLSGPSLPVFDDRVLDSVKAAWKLVTGGADEDFMRLSRRSDSKDNE